MDDFNVFPEPVWADSDSFERTFLLWEPKHGIRLIVVQEDTDPEPLIFLLPLIDQTGGADTGGSDVRPYSFTFTELRSVLDRAEAIFAKGEPPFPEGMQD